MDMKKWWLKFPVKFKLYLPIFIGIILSVVLVATFSIYNFKNSYYTLLRENLMLESQTILKMLERERDLKFEKVSTNLKMAHELFYTDSFEILNETLKYEAVNQINKNKHYTEVKKWKQHGNFIQNSTSFVDKAQAIFGGTVTIFQKIDKGFLRISTNVMKLDSTRAVGTYIPFDSPVVREVKKGNTYYGRAFVVNDWYITAYEPIYNNSSIVGMLYVGDKEKDLETLKHKISELKIGKSGYVFVFDKDGEVVIPSINFEFDLKNIEFQQNFLGKKLNTFSFQNRLFSIVYYEDFNLYVVASINPELETKDVIHKIILSAFLIGLLIIIVFSFFVYYTTNSRVHSFLKEIEISNLKLTSIKSALQDSENRFQTLFDNTGDEIFVTDAEMNIVEVNNSACEVLGYTRDELLKMKLTDIKPPMYIDKIRKNRDQIVKLGKHTYESEHLTKDGKILQVEMKSRVIEYGNSKFFLSISRNISQRKELERKIIQAVIVAEEKERERLAKDIHDGLGPLLSTIKMYVDELKNEFEDEQERIKMYNLAMELIDDAISDTRTISNNLTPRVMNEYGLIKAIESFCKKINSTNKINVSFSHQGFEHKIDQSIEMVLYRVINELINNTIKHASANKIDISISLNDSVLTLNYTDDGKGFDIQQAIESSKSGLGLKNILSRVKSINGKIDFLSDNSGSQVFIKVDTNYDRAIV